MHLENNNLLPPFPFSFSNQELGVADVLWHFTSMDALLPILKTGFWAKHSSCQSDKLDCVLRNKLRKMWCRLILERNAIRDKTSVPRGNLRMLQKAFGGDVPFPSFITCFSYNPDFEAMWERYGLNGGVAIGCKYEFIANMKRRSNRDFIVKDGACEYCDYTICSNYLTEIDEIIEEAIRVAYSEKKLEECDKILEELKRLEDKMLFVKRDIFKSEREWRLVHTISLDKQDDSFRFYDMLISSNGRLVFNVKIDNHPNDWISEIRVSPFGNAEENYQMALLIAHSFGIDLRKVTPPSTYN